MFGPSKIKKIDIPEEDRCVSVVNIQDTKCLDLGGEIYMYIAFCSRW